MHRNRVMFLSMSLILSLVVACGEQALPTATRSPASVTPLRHSFEDYGTDLGEVADTTLDDIACARWQGCDGLSEVDSTMIYSYAANLMLGSYGDCHYVGFALLSLLGNGRIKLGREIYGFRGAQNIVPVSYNPNTDDMVSNNIIIISPLIAGGLFENRSILAHEGAHAVGARSFAATGEQRRLENETIYEPLAASIGNQCSSGGF